MTNSVPLWPAQSLDMGPIDFPLSVSSLPQLRARVKIGAVTELLGKSVN